MYGAFWAKVKKVRKPRRRKRKSKYADGWAGQVRQSFSWSYLSDFLRLRRSLLGLGADYIANFSPANQDVIGPLKRAICGKTRILNTGQRMDSGDGGGGGGGGRGSDLNVQWTISGEACREYVDGPLSYLYFVCYAWYVGLHGASNGRVNLWLAFQPNFSMERLLEWWALHAPSRWILPKQDFRTREILEDRSSTNTCKLTFSWQPLVTCGTTTVALACKYNELSKIVKYTI